jgi:hypothetical protein
MLDAETLAEELHALNQSGELSSALERHKIQTLLVHPRGKEFASSPNRWSLMGYQYNRLANVYREVGLGELKDYMSDYQYDASRGAFTFTSGDRYPNFDADLLGGSGDGTVLKVFQEAGLSIV